MHQKILVLKEHKQTNKHFWGMSITELETNTNILRVEAENYRKQKQSPTLGTEEAIN